MQYMTIKKGCYGLTPNPQPLSIAAKFADKGWYLDVLLMPNKNVGEAAFRFYCLLSSAWMLAGKLAVSLCRREEAYACPCCSVKQERMRKSFSRSERLQACTWHAGQVKEF
jgi:hypothetical protein